MRLSVASAGYAIRSATIHGTDVSEGLEVPNDGDVDNLVIEVTDQHTAISGSVIGANGEPMHSYSVAVFPQNRDRRAMSRYLATTGPDQSGRFVVRGLPSGDYYVVALPKLDPTEWPDPELLSRLEGKATRIAIREGERRTIALQVRW